MPKKSSSLLAWVPAQQAYVLSEGSSSTQLAFEPETPGWFAWLEHVPSFAFAGQRGSATLRKERLHGEAYWYAYRRAGEKLTKKYVGKTAALTISRLEQIAGLLEAVQPPGESPLVDVPGTLSSEVVSEPQATVPIQKSMARPPADVVQRDPLLFTKLHVPRPRAQLVPRPHLVERLQQASTLTLTLVSAPAGFGKTTLLSQWITERRIPVAWLSLEPEDNDPLRFLSYLIAALQTVQANVGTSVSTLLHSPQPPPLETLLAMLTNDLTSHLAGDVALVLDDYHVITAIPLHQALLFLVEHCPRQLHLVLASRADPPLPLARLRARGQLTELRAAQLQFAEEETRLFLQKVMGLELSSEEVATLQSRTEGWIAGLHLAALSLQEHRDVQQFLADFTGSHRHLIDYLVEDVLSHQSADVQSFLLHTSILERLCSSLCEAVTDEPTGQAMLERVEAAHLFLTPLDDRRQWYRYHHLFAEVLRHRLRHEASELVPLLHRRASRWYEQQGLMREAVQHALSANDFERAARLLEHAAELLAKRGEMSTLQRWGDLLPPQLIRSRLSLCLWHGWGLVSSGRYAEAASMLEAAEQLRDTATAVPAARGSVVAAAEVGHASKLTDSEIRGEIAGLRAGLALRQADLPRAILLGQEALEQISQVSPRRGLIVWTLGRAYGANGDVDEDEVHASYDPVYAQRFWHILVQTETVLRHYRSHFLGKSSPVHFFWGSFDLAVTLFSGRRAPERPGADRITREGYSHEVISCGFWPGSDNFPAPAFYSYTYPGPPGLSTASIRPQAAFYSQELGEFLLRYDDMRAASSPEQALLSFFQSTYEAGTTLAQWDRGSLERKAHLPA